MVVVLIINLDLKQFIPSYQLKLPNPFSPFLTNDPLASSLGTMLTFLDSGMTVLDAEYPGVEWMLYEPTIPDVFSSVIISLVLWFLTSEVQGKMFPDKLFNVRLTSSLLLTTDYCVTAFLAVYGLKYLGWKQNALCWEGKICCSIWDSTEEFTLFSMFISVDILTCCSLKVIVLFALPADLYGLLSTMTSRGFLPFVSLPFTLLLADVFETRRLALLFRLLA